MIELLPLSIGVGLVVSLIFSELFGLVPGGMVVPGYIALYLTRPQDVIITLLAAFVTFTLVHAISSVMILYGRRRTVLMILLGYFIGMLLRALPIGYAGPFGDEWNLIGFIIPGLIAIWLDRQGVTETLSSLMIISAVVRLVLIMLVGTDLKV